MRAIRALLPKQVIEAVLGIETRGWHLDADPGEPRCADGNEQGRNGVDPPGEVRDTLFDQIGSGKGLGWALVHDRESTLELGTNDPDREAAGDP